MPDELEPTPEGTLQPEIQPEIQPEAPQDPENVETPPEVTPPAPTPPAPPKPPQSIEERYKASSREAQKLNTALKSLTSTSPPTEEELQKRFHTWDLMTETEKEIATAQFQNERTVNAMSLKEALQEENRRWEKDYLGVVAKNQELKDHEQEFRDYAYLKENHGTPLSVLAESFMYRLAQKKPAATPPAKPGLQPGSGGRKDTPTKSKRTAEEVQDIRRTDPKRYNEMVQKGEIDL